MKLTIENFAKIQRAEIDVDGITVIAGENNTGKSTVGKVLYALFNTTSNFEERVLEQRFQETGRICSSTLREFALQQPAFHKPAESAALCQRAGGEAGEARPPSAGGVLLQNAADGF